MTQEEFIAFARRIAPAYEGDTETLEVFKEIENDYKIKESVSESEVFAPDGMKWSQKYSDTARRYTDRFFSPVEQENEVTTEVHEDSTPVTFEGLFTPRT